MGDKDKVKDKAKVRTGERAMIMKTNGKDKDETGNKYGWVAARMLQSINGMEIKTETKTGTRQKQWFRQDGDKTTAKRKTMKTRSTSLTPCLYLKSQIDDSCHLFVTKPKQHPKTNLGMGNLFLCYIFLIL